MDQGVFPFSNMTDSDLLHHLNDSVPHQFPLHIIDDLLFKPFKYYDYDNVTNNLSIDCTMLQPICIYLFCDDPNLFD